MTWSRRFVALAAALVLAALALISLGLTSCGERTSTRRTLTERERDSTLGKSAIPGAGVVTRALEVSDSAAARAKRMNDEASGQ